MRKIYTSILSLSVAVVVAAGTLTPALVRAWGDSDNGRPSYTLEQINRGELGNKITFNSISDNKKIGNEKNFVAAKVAGATVETWNANTINVKDGETYTIRLYVHNNNPKGMQAIAKNVKATFSIPTTVAKSQTIIGYLDSSNASPTRYWDEVVLNASENVYLEYVDGSARYVNAKLGTVKLPNSIVTSNGALLGYDKLDGNIPGCYQYDGVVMIDVRVHNSVAAKVAKTVRIKGTKTWGESVNAKIGDEVEYQIEYVNLLASQVNNVMIRDVLPANVEYVKDSTYLYNAAYQSGVLLKDNTLTTDGINIGSYTAKGNAYVRFTGKVVDKSLACGSNQLVNWASATINKDVYKDDASVMVTKECKKEEDPVTKISKMVRIKGTTKWMESVSANIGDEIEYKIEYSNLSNAKVSDVMLKDTLPANVAYVKGSTYLYVGNDTKGKKMGDTITTTGLNIGNYEGKVTATVQFTAKVVNKSLECGSNKLVNWASVTVNKKTYKDDASTTVKRDDDTCKPAPDPDPDPEPEPDPDPVVIISTGPETIVTGAIGAGSVVTAAGYFIASRKKLM